MQLTSLNSYIEPYVSVGTYATAEINLLAASAGINADLALIYVYVQGHADGSFTMPTTSSSSIQNPPLSATIAAFQCRAPLAPSQFVF